uniref:Uncharacterized protein n=1 Tax=Ciona savignyi TaxID=51511 RepID=H2ZDW8_CIOSA
MTTASIYSWLLHETRCRIRLMWSTTCVGWNLMSDFFRWHCLSLALFTSVVEYWWILLSFNPNAVFRCCFTHSSNKHASEACAKSSIAASLSGRR